jgi:hypothetical protein
VTRATGQVKSGGIASHNCIQHIKHCRPAQSAIVQQRGKDGEEWLLQKYGRVPSAGSARADAAVDAPDAPALGAKPANALTAMVHRTPRLRQAAMDPDDIANMLVGMAIDGTIYFNAVSDEHLK